MQIYTQTQRSLHCLLPWFHERLLHCSLYIIFTIILMSQGEVVTAH